MSEVTREQIKEAFKKTIERWEKIVEDVSYFAESTCLLCRMERDPGRCEAKSCPIYFYTSKSGCEGTPYSKFDHDRTPKNALAELNFLRKVYIWWIEGEDKDVKGKPKEARKEEWVDITKKVRWEIEFCGIGFYYLGGHYGGERIVNADISGVWIPIFPGNQNFKVENDQENTRQNFRILRKS